ncbi:GlxA family transcriptional regulator [Neptunicoccus cionae]|uniref:GlxA family transcriptional regulator n=1 Tax=Neptunicoccus cionae TaxID=2035344 RepID=UPI000C76B663|nr:GlxA family transcriptional regulator [Amylibacter cionae]PLS23008.1 AraC family transcriptional regulator [Amylibacter cionae]
MPIWKKSSSGELRVGVLLFDHFSNHCLANAIEPLRAANDLAGVDLFDWHFLSLDGNSVTSSSGLEITPDGRLDGMSGEMLFVMPSYAHHSHTGAPTQLGLRAAAKRFGIIAGFDTGAWLMAVAGLLRGRRATIHWEELDAFAETFPEVEVLRERYVIDGNRITCTGAIAAFDLAMHLIASQHGEALRQDVATLFMSDARVDGGFGRARDRLVGRALDLMQAHVESPLSVKELARRLGVSQKTLEARVKAALGATPRQVYRRQRMVVARNLVHDTELGIAEIAVRCGYRDATAMTRAFRAEFATSPRAMRGAEARGATA